MLDVREEKAVVETVFAIIGFLHYPLEILQTASERHL
jgi:hypothetical protein